MSSYSGGGSAGVDGAAVGGMAANTGYMNNMGGGYARPAPAHANQMGSSYMGGNAMNDGQMSNTMGNNMHTAGYNASPNVPPAAAGQGNSVSESIEVTSDAIGGIIGRGKWQDLFLCKPDIHIDAWRCVSGGETVKYLQQLSGARIQVEPNTGGVQPSRKVNVSGE